MKTILRLFTVMSLFLTFSCQDDDATLESVTVPQNFTVSTDITTDGSGNVTFTATADNALTYRFVFPDGSSDVAPGGVYTKRFTKTGLNRYVVTAIAYGQAGVSTSQLVEFEVESDFSDLDAIEFLTGYDPASGSPSTKTWYWAADVPNHLGVGPNNDDVTQNYFWAFFSFTDPFALNFDAASCAYDDEFIFSTTNGENLNYLYDNNGATFFNRSFASVANGASPDDQCYEFDTTSGGTQTVTLGPSESVVEAERKRGTVMTFNDGGFMGYYIGTTQYEILSITDNRMVTRAIQGNDPGLAWYQIFTSTKPVESTGPVAEEDDFPNLVWSDEFDTNGAPDAANWTYDIGTGQAGWGNNEEQYYTSRADNVSVEDGMLKITAKRESYQGENFTSARIKTEGLQDFTYGRVEARMKLPAGVGTWPAFWMLGADYQTNAWPAAGEIDIMEHVGRNQNEILSTLHFPENFGANGISEGTTVAGVSTDFHIYAAEWTETQIRFYVDDELYHIFENDATKPFNKDFFIILNVAMGGNLGGAIDASFQQSTMEVDYVRVYKRD